MISKLQDLNLGRGTSCGTCLLRSFTTDGHPTNRPCATKIGLFPIQMANNLSPQALGDLVSGITIQNHPSSCWEVRFRIQFSASDWRQPSHLQLLPWHGATHDSPKMSRSEAMSTVLVNLYSTYPNTPFSLPTHSDGRSRLNCGNSRSPSQVNVDAVVYWFHDLSTCKGHPSKS